MTWSGISTSKENFPSSKTKEIINLIIITQINLLTSQHPFTGILLK